MAKKFDVQAALRDGYSPQEVQDYLSQNNLQPLQTNSTPQPQQDLASSIGGALGNILGAVVQPAKQYGAMVGEGGNALLSMLQHPGGVGATLTGGQMSPTDINAYANYKPAFLSQNELNQYSTPQGAATAGGKNLAGALSYMVPAGRGAGLLAKILPGFAAGGLYGISQKDATPQSVAGNAALGGAGGAILGKIIPGIGGAVEGAGNMASNTGNRLIRSQFNITAKEAEKIGLTDVIPTLSRYGITNLDKIERVAPQITGDSGIITQMTNDAVAKSGPVDLGGIANISQNLLDNATLLP